MQHLIHLGADVNAYPDPIFGSDGGWLTALQTATVLRHYMMVRLLMSSGASVNAGAHPENGMTALQAIASTSDQYMVHLLIASGADINAEPAQSHGKTALQAAASTGDRYMVQFLVDSGANVNAKPAPFYGRTALRAAIESGNIEIARFLLSLSAKVSSDTLSEAVESGSIELVQLLLDSHVYLQVEGGPAVETAIILGSPAILTLLLSAGADANVGHSDLSEDKDDIGSLALELAFYFFTIRPSPKHEEVLAVIKVLLDNGANDKSKALRPAVRCGSRESVELLLSSGADVNFAKPDVDDITALSAAAENGDLEIVRLLLNYRAKGTSGALQVAAWCGHTDVMQLLLSEGADVNAASLRLSDDTQQTGLQAASSKGDLDIVRLLLDAGALTDINPSVDEVGTALQFSAMEGHFDIVFELLHRGADANAAARGDDGRTALEGAAEHGRLDIVQLLLNVQAEVRGTRALGFARKEGHDGVVQLLSEHLAKD